MRKLWCIAAAATMFYAGAMGGALSGASVQDGKKLFEEETFGGNGRTCRTCHSRETGTTSPEDAQKRFNKNPGDPLFVHDGSDDGNGIGASRMMSDATVLITIPLPPGVIMDGDPSIHSATFKRGIPTTLNTPALERIFMVDGRQPDLPSQAAGAIAAHAQALVAPTGAQLQAIADFQLTNQFFSSPATKHFASGGPAPELPAGQTASEQRGRFFFEDVVDFQDPKHGFCAACHSGPMLNHTNAFLEAIGGPPVGSRFQSVLVSELNQTETPHDFAFPGGAHIVSPDPGRALITGVADVANLFSESVNAFKIPQLRGIRHTAPYFHDNSRKSLEDVMEHYAIFFSIVTGGLELTAQDKQDIVAFMKLLD
jgi:cytochrome c peroxidase